MTARTQPGVSGGSPRASPARPAVAARASVGDDAAAGGAAAAGTHTTGAWPLGWTATSYSGGLPLPGCEGGASSGRGGADSRLMLPHVFLNPSARHVGLCTYISRSAAEPKVVMCTSNDSNSLETYAVPVSAIRRGWEAVKAATRRVFDGNAIAHPGFVEFNTINDLALTFGFDARARRTVYKVWELDRFTEVLTIPADDVVDCKFSCGFLIISTNCDVALDSAGKTAAVHVPLPPRSRHREEHGWTGRPSRMAVEVTAERCSEDLLAMRDALRRNDSAGIFAATNRLRRSTEEHALLAIHVFPVRAEANAVCMVTPMVPGATIQLLELFNQHVLFKQDGYRPRIVHLASGTYVDAPTAVDSASPTAQVFLYNTERSLSVQAHCLEVRGKRGELLSTVAGLEATAVRTAMQRCSQTGNNVFPLADETTCLLMGVHPADDLSAHPTARDTAAGCLMHMSITTGRILEALHTYDRPDSLAAAALRGVTVMRYDEAQGVLFTGNAAGEVFIWEEDPDATPAARAAARARECADAASLGPDMVSVDDVYCAAPSACRCPQRRRLPRAPSPPSHVPLLSPVAPRKHGDAPASLSPLPAGRTLQACTTPHVIGAPSPRTPLRLLAAANGGSGAGGGGGSGAGGASVTANPAHGRRR